MMCLVKWTFRLWTLAPALLLVQTPSSRADVTNRPNVVILFVDQLRWSEVGCYGNRVIRTPHLDRLASEGARFTHAFANFPSCSPARSTLLSGRHARSNGVYANQNETEPTSRPTNRDPTLAETLAAAGYTTAMIGKWHLTPAPRTLGFRQSWLGGTGPGGDGYLRGPWHADGSIGTNHIYEGYTLEHQSELAADFMRQHRDRPFLLHLAPSPPHMPIASLPEPYKSMYQPAEIPLRTNVWKDGQLPFDERWFKIYLGEDYPVTLPPGINLRDLHALYYGQVTAVDDWVGRILKAIGDLGLAENAIVLFSSDHGDLLGSHHLFNKNQHYDEAIRVPLLVRWPGRIKPALHDWQVVSLVDLMPTLLDLCGVKIPTTVQGTSFAPVLLGNREVVGDNVAYIETTVNEGVRTRRYVYWCNRKHFGNEHLFDVERDPYQTNDVIRDPGYADAAADLRAKTKAWRERTPSVQPANPPPAKTDKN
jgi:arylsulfatase A-like enzyme